jgi:calpain-15
MILEKAWAKLHGSYSFIVSGHSSEVYVKLCKSPCESVYHMEMDEGRLWYLMRRATELSYHMSTGSADEKLSSAQLSGVKHNHAYGILCAHEISIKGTKWRMLKLRNPWGHMEWTGNWKFSDPKWTAEAKQILKLDNKANNDGQFVMTVEAYV